MKINKPPGHLKSFLVLTLMLSWVIWIPLVLIRWGVGSIELPDGVNTLLSVKTGGKNSYAPRVSLLDIL
jgi:hypothetical protein